MGDNPRALARGLSPVQADKLWYNDYQHRGSTGKFIFTFFQPYDQASGYIEATDIKALEQDEEVRSRS